MPPGENVKAFMSMTAKKKLEFSSSPLNPLPPGGGKNPLGSPQEFGGEGKSGAENQAGGENSSQAVKN
jgi:hypothetical protein